jgi:hypothetical protein
VFPPHVAPAPAPEPEPVAEAVPEPQPEPAPKKQPKQPKQPKEPKVAAAAQENFDDEDYDITLIETVQKFGKSPMFILGAAVFTLITLIQLFTSLGADSLLGVSARLNPALSGTEAQSILGLLGDIPGIAGLLIMLPQLLIAAGLCLCAAAFSKLDDRVQSAPGLSLIKFGIIGEMVFLAISVILFAVGTVSAENLDIGLNFVLFALFFIIITAVSAVVFRAALKIVGNFNHIVTTGRHLDDFSALAPKLLCVFVFHQVYNMIASISNVGFGDVGSFLVILAGLAVAVAFMQFRADYTEMNNMGSK